MAEEDYSTNQAAAAPPSMSSSLNVGGPTISRARRSPATRKPGISRTPPRG